VADSGEVFGTGTAEAIQGSDGKGNDEDPNNTGPASPNPGGDLESGGGGGCTTGASDPQSWMVIFLAFGLGVLFRRREQAD
jgi:MYXO-CTERM domain-containing protein